MNAGMAGAALEEAMAEAGPTSAISFASLRVLILEDESCDAELAMRELRRSWRTVDWRRVDTELAFRSALQEPWDVILSDYNVPQFDGPAAIRLARSLTPQIPVIVLTGQIGEELAAGCIRDGAVDYVLKQSLPRLAAAVARALREQRLRTERDRLFNLSVDMLCVADLAGNFRQVNPAWIKTLGWTSEELLGQPWMARVHPEERETTEAAVRTPTQAVCQFENRYRCADGTYRWLSWRCFPLPAEGIMFAVARDITDRRRLEEQFRQAQKLEAIGTLAGGIAHDFNNILAAITGYVELARQAAGDNPAVCVPLDEVQTASARAASLVRQILAFSRRDEQQQRQPLQLNEALAEPLKLLRATIPSVIEFDVELAPELPAVLADATQIHQLVVNLCTNAWQAMKPRPGRLQVRLEKFAVDALVAESNPRLRPGTYVRLSVSDTGRGMDPETQARIFEPFFTTKAPGEGTGLGLSVVHGIVQGHDGAITVYSELGTGTAFHVYLPAYEGDVPAKAEPASEVPRGDGERVLFVDDEKPLALLGQKMLERLGYKVEATSSVLAALDRFRSDPDGFDLVVTDMTMPTMTGIDFTGELLVIRPDLPIILTTGFNASLTPARVRELGIRELVLKPHSMQSLSQAMHRAFKPRGNTGPLLRDLVPSAEK